MPTYTDEQIAAMDNVTPEIAAKYLGTNARIIRQLVRAERVPFGSAVKLKRYVYYISGPALVHFKRYGHAGLPEQGGGDRGNA
jgi:hypothetical protein